ncbi:single-stranded-DNA-specific exonuclease RecJ [Candidatus Saccharibacteria bacterium]|nr:single-stranded-DNA-specific exonuclease RecJ [Candidatus Saccharibacteria bacterium]
MNKLFTQLLAVRNINEDFLHPKYENLSDPYNVPDIKKAVERIKNSINNQEKILIYGDYDVDGITASTLMEQTLILAGIPQQNIQIMLPDRFIDGYGMSPRLIERAKEQKINLVITVDCGSRNHSIIDELNKLNIDTIITDHHECDPTTPSAVATINPHRQDTPAPQLHSLAGVGVAFKLAQALVKANLIKNGQEKWLLDLVLIGTICDHMELTGENRILCYYGIKVLEKTRRKGLIELMRLAGTKQITSESIGFQIGPRLNASGRLTTATTSLNLLRTAKATESAMLASQLEQLNKDRRSAQRTALKEITERGITKDPVIVEAGKWHEGIIGIVAGRLVEQYQKPAFVLTEIDGDIYKGSGRSFGDFSLAEALNYVKDTIIGGGGHAGAAGVQVPKNKLNDFREQINKYYQNLNLKDQSRYLISHPDLTATSLKDFTRDFMAELRALEPFGPGNKEPIFQISGANIINQRRMGADGRHLRLDICDSQKNTLKLVSFNSPESWFTLDPSASYSFLIQPIENDFNGIRSVEARLIDVI